MYELDGISWLIMFLRQRPSGRGRKTVATKKCHTTSYINLLKVQSQSIFERVKIIRSQGVNTFGCLTKDVALKVVANLPSPNLPIILATCIGTGNLTCIVL